jgi:hypothetical protein
MENTVQQIDHFEAILLQSKILHAELEATSLQSIENCKAIEAKNELLLNSLNN